MSQIGRYAGHFYYISKKFLLDQNVMANVVTYQILYRTYEICIGEVGIK